MSFAGKIKLRFAASLILVDKRELAARGMVE